MSLHPKFSEDSTCLNCAAFEDWGATGVSIRGQCHRHAPRPFTPTAAFDADGDLQGTTERSSDGAEWPLLTNDSEMFCCEWIPKPAAKGSWPTWDELLTRHELNAKHAGVRAKNVIGQWRADTGDASVEIAMSSDGLRRRRNFGEASYQLVLAAIEGWRRDGGKLHGATA